jgi:hypothetical protein
MGERQGQGRTMCPPHRGCVDTPLDHVLERIGELT